MTLRISFIWLKDADVALPTYCASEPVAPLLISKATNLFKLFLLKEEPMEDFIYKPDLSVLM